MINLIIGRTASGKDHLAKILHDKFNMQGVLSRTTRAKRNDDDASHIFVSREEAEKAIETDKTAIASTEIDNNLYYVLPEDIDDKDYYIIDPKGAYELVSNMSDTLFHIIYLKAPSDDVRKEYYLKRSDTTEDEFQSRNESEKEQFDEFEHKIDTCDNIYDFGLSTNVHTIDVFTNDYNETTLEKYAQGIAQTYKMIVNMASLVEDVYDHGMFPKQDKGKFLVRDGRTGTVKDVSSEEFASTLITNENPDVFRLFVTSILMNCDGIELK